MKRHAVAALSCLLLASVSGCVGSIKIGSSTLGMPQCPATREQTPGHVSSALLLIAQAVPTASMVPCVHALAAGWTFNHLDARSNKAQFWLDSDRAGVNAVTVTLARDCDSAGAAELTSYESGILLFERSNPAGSGYHGDRYYVYDGGCVTYHLDLGGNAGSQAMPEISEMLQFVDRDVLRRYVHRYSGGRFELDASNDSGS